MISVPQRIILPIFAALVLASCTDSLLPNDFIQGESIEILAEPKDLHACVVAATMGIDGVAIDEEHYDARFEDVPLKTSMANVSGTVQRRTGGKVMILIGTLSKHDEPEVQTFVGWRVKAIAAAISKKCGHG